MPPMLHLDDAQTIFFRQQLEYIKAQVYETQYPALKARGFIPIDNAGGPGAEAIRWAEFDQAGVAKIIADYADDLPMVGVSGKEYTTPVRSLGDGYEYSIQDIRAAALAGRPLVPRMAMAARRAIEQAIDDILASGDANHGLPGFLNGASVPSQNAVNGAGGTPDWASKTSDEIRQDFQDSINATLDATHGVEAGPFDFIVPVAQHAILAQSKNTQFSDKTILEFLLASNPYVRSISPWYKLKGAGAGATDRMVMFTQAQDKLEGHIPVEFEQMDPQLENLAYVVPCHARCGGVIFYYPLSARYVDGI